MIWEKRQSSGLLVIVTLCVGWMVLGTMASLRRAVLGLRQLAESCLRAWPSALGWPVGNTEQRPICTLSTSSVERFCMGFLSPAPHGTLGTLPDVRCLLSRCFIGHLSELVLTFPHTKTCVVNLLSPVMQSQQSHLQMLKVGTF
jgi:hypothetical protein